jgi:hypothetical protein
VMKRPEATMGISAFRCQSCNYMELYANADLKFE